MRANSWFLPAVALGVAAIVTLPAPRSVAYTLLGHSLDLTQRDFRVFNNFEDATANDNQTPHPNFPGATGAAMAIWKGVIEWQSALHGDGAGDVTQPLGLGSGGANFDASWQGEAHGIGGIDDNIISAISSCTAGTVSFTEMPGANGWRIRFCEENGGGNVVWADGPGSSIGPRFDIQGVAAFQYGISLGLGFSTVNNATMYNFISPGNTGPRSLAADDIAGIQAIYGVAAPGKPRIDEVCVSESQMSVTGANFDLVDNEVWFTAGLGGHGAPVVVSGVPSDGTSLLLTIPPAAQPGDVLVRIGGGMANESLSEAHPTDLMTGDGGCTSCPSPTSFCQTSPNSVGSGMLMGSGGSQSVAAEDFTLSAFLGPANQPGIFFYGELQTSLPFGDGLRCVGAGPAGTFRLPPTALDPFGDVTYALDWSTAPVGAGPGEIEAGDVWNFQFWYRDPANGMSGFNLSDGLEVEFCL